jgi:hypothetical protein
MYKKGGVGTWWRRNPSGTVPVTWGSVPGGVEEVCGSYLRLFRPDLDTADVPFYGTEGV